MKNKLSEIATGLGVLLSALLVLNPWHILMPSAFAMFLLAALLVLFVVLAIFVVREGEGDERETASRADAGRTAFLFGAAVLVLGIIYGDLTHSLDPWLVVALFAMIAAKFAKLAVSDWL